MHAKMLFIHVNKNSIFSGGNDENNDTTTENNNNNKNIIIIPIVTVALIFIGIAIYRVFIKTSSSVPKGQTVPKGQIREKVYPEPELRTRKSREPFSLFPSDKETQLGGTIKVLKKQLKNLNNLN